ncbi:MAG: PriCT-2 domain-containing protein [Polaromonas sp.]|nr:PriCT-2 domain-containing protein [Polaromonas sp.]
MLCTDDPTSEPISSELLSAVPLALQAIDHWLMWRLEPNEIAGQPPRKVPYYTNGNKRHGKQGDDDDRRQLSSFVAARQMFADKKCDGIGFAFLPGCGVFGLDFDNCVKNGIIEQRILDVCEGLYTEFSPSGTGIHALGVGELKSGKDNANKADRVGGVAKAPRLDGKFDVEFFGDSGFLTMTGRQTDDSKLFGYDAAPITPRVETLYKERIKERRTRGAGDSAQDGVDSMEGLTPRLGWTIEEARAYLKDCDPDTNRETWLKVLMALHHEFDGGDDGLDLADEWSSTGSSYGGRSDVEGRWFSFHGTAGGEPVTGRWLLFWRSEQLKRQKYSAEDAWTTLVAQTTDLFKLRESICVDVSRDERLDDAARGQVAIAIQKAFKQLGKQYPIADVRKMLKPTHAVTQLHDLDAPDWLDKWFYVTDRDQFHRYDSGEWLSAQGFNMKYTRFMPRDPSTGDPKKEAAVAAREDFGVATVTRAEYIPWAGATFDLEGVSAVNTYRPSSVPQAVKHLSSDGKKAVEIVKTHLRLLCNGRGTVIDTMVNWMAHNVQNPGAKIRWAPLIKGIQGDGKTVMGSLLAACMGKSNVKTVSSKVLATDFTGWSVGSCVVVFEEVKLTGHNRYDILNAVKPVIANDTIEVHKKGQDADGGAVNVTNYICFTNFADALPLDDTDRRYMVIFSPFNSVDDLVAAIKAAAGYVGSESDVLEAYFSALHDAISLHGAELRRWLLDHKIGAEFKPNGRAPMTDEKRVMIGMGVTDEERAVEEALEKGGMGIGPDIFVSDLLKQAVVEADVGFDLQTQALSKLYTRMGWLRFPKKVWWCGSARIIYTKGIKDWEVAEVQRRLDMTKPETGCDDLF